MRQTLILSLLLVLAGAVSAQDCRIISETDPYTKEKKLSTGFLTITGATVTVDADTKEIDFFFVVPDKCFDDQSNVFIHFEGNKMRTMQRNAGSRNCEGNFHIKFRNGTTSTTVLKRLGTMKVAQFVFNGSDKKEVIVTLTPEQQDLLMKSVACLDTEAKTLLPR